MSDQEVAKAGILRRDEMSFTLVATAGVPHYAETAGKALTSISRLIREVGKSVAPGERIDVALVRVDLLDDKLRFTFRVVPAAPRTSRRRAA